MAKVASIYHSFALFIIGSAHAHNISCSESNQCINTNIECLSGGDCNVLCSTKYPCSQSIFHCPIDAHCRVTCNGINSCTDSTFNASHSIQLMISGCKQSDFCSDISIYCPLNTTKHSQSCWISGQWTCFNDDCKHKYIPGAPSSNEPNDSSIYIILSSIVAFSFIIGCLLICRKLKIRYNKTKGNKDKMADSLQKSEEEMIANEIAQSLPEQVHSSLDNADFILPQPSTSTMTFSTQMISELNSPNAMPLRNRLSSDYSLDINNFSMPSFEHYSVYKHDTKWEGTLSPIYSEQSMGNTQIQSIENNEMSLTKESIKKPTQAL